MFAIHTLLITCLALSCKSPSQEQLEERFPEMKLDVNLPTGRSGKRLQKATEDCSCGYILVGPRKKQFLSFRQEYRDSIFIQVNDVLIELDKVSTYLNELRVNDGPRVKAFLFVDRRTPQSFVTRLIEAIRLDTPTVPMFFVVDNERLEVIKAR